MKAKVRHALFWLFTIGLLGAGIQLLGQLWEYAKDYQVHQKVLHEIEMKTEPASEGAQGDINGTLAQAPGESKYQVLYEENQAFVGWVSIPDTQLNYPVMQSIEEPMFYLYKNFYQEDSISGTPFVSETSVIAPQSDNIVIYGHNMKNGTMFHTLLSYQEKDYQKKHPTICFDTLEKEGRYEVMAVFYEDVTNGNGHFPFYAFTVAQDAAGFDSFVESCKARSLYDAGVTAAYGDHLITLVTCSYHTENERMVVVACEKDAPRDSQEMTERNR